MPGPTPPALRRPRALPLPIEPLRDSQPLATADWPTRAAVHEIVIAYWTGGCRDMPSEDAELAAYAHACALPRWRRIAPRVRECLTDILPKLRLIWEYKRDVQARRNLAALKGGMAVARNWREGRQGRANAPAISPHSPSPPDEPVNKSVFGDPLNLRPPPSDRVVMASGRDPYMGKMQSDSPQRLAELGRREREASKAGGQPMLTEKRRG